MPQFWAEISEELPYIESLADPQFSELPAENRPLAALLCSKVYFYLGERDEAVEFALRAAAAFEQEPYGEFKETIIAGCIDRAIAETDSDKQTDARLNEIVDGVIRQGSSDGAKLVSPTKLRIIRGKLTTRLLALRSRSAASTSLRRSTRTRARPRPGAAARLSALLRMGSCTTRGCCGTFFPRRSAAPAVAMRGPTRSAASC